MGTIIVDAEMCSVCEHLKPRTEFYTSELCGMKRCKSCFRKRVDAQNKGRGRQSTSLSMLEVEWLGTLLRALPSSDLRDLARRAEYVKITCKVTNMAARGTEAKRNAAAELEAQQKGT